MVDIIKRNKVQVQNLQIGTGTRTAEKPAPVREAAIATLGRVAIQTMEVVGKELHQDALEDAAKQRTLAQTNRPLDNPTVAGVKSAALLKIFEHLLESEILIKKAPATQKEVLVYSMLIKLQAYL